MLAGPSRLAMHTPNASRPDETPQRTEGASEGIQPGLLHSSDLILFLLLCVGPRRLEQHGGSAVKTLELCGVNFRHL